MGKPAAKQGDQVLCVCIHKVMVPTGPTLTPTPLPHPFAGIINGGVSSDVKIMGQAAATVDSTADNTPPHIPSGGPSFQQPPQNKATIDQGSGTVRINGKAAARAGDTARTCCEISTKGAVLAVSTVMIGG